MGILQDIAGKIFGGGDQNNLINAVASLLGHQQSGGLAGLVDQFKAKGLGDVVNSWVSTGKNLPISPEQIKHALGGDTIKNLASQAGISTEKITSHLSELLPKVVDKLTPDGKIPQGDVVSKGLGMLKDLMK
jgi:uncharacterized protein YidB (DUF937 family)